MKRMFFTLLIVCLIAACSSKEALPPTASLPATLTVNIQPEITPSLTPVLVATPVTEPKWLYLSDLQPALAKVGYWSFAIGKYPASEGSMVQGQTIHNGNQTYPHGLFAAAPSNLRYELNGKYQTFEFEIFIDQSMVCDTDGALFQVYLDGDLIYSQHVDAPKQAPSTVKTVSLDVSGGKQLLLHADPGEKDDIACDATIWGEPKLLTATILPAVVAQTGKLEQQPVLARELERFTNAMRAAGAISQDRSISLVDVQVANFKDLNGTSFEAAFVHLDPDPAKAGEAFEGDYPLLINENNQWKKVGLRFWAYAAKMNIALPMIANDSMLDDPTFPLELYRQNATQISVDEYFSARHIFADFKSADWGRVLTDWDQVQYQLDQGILPAGFAFHWENIDRTIETAKTLGMDLRAANIFPDYLSVPQEIVDGQYKPDELEHLFEFMVKVPMVKYRDQINTWLVVSETTGWLSSGRGPEKSWGFPYLQLGGVGIIEKAYIWAHEVSPDAILLLADDHILLNKMISDSGPTQPHWNQVFFKTISELKARNAPINAIDIENNFWIYNPPDPEFMRAQLQKIQALGYSIYAPEVTVLESENFPWTSIQSKKQIKVSNPAAAQALIYQHTLQAYLDLGIPWFGLGGLTDRFSFWRYSGYPETHAMIYDYNQQPKASYYLLVSSFYAHLKGN